MGNKLIQVLPVWIGKLHFPSITTMSRQATLTRRARPTRMTRLPTLTTLTRLTSLN